jgi:hypothetical protein
MITAEEVLAELRAGLPHLGRTPLEDFLNASPAPWALYHRISMPLLDNDGAPLDKSSLVVSIWIGSKEDKDKVTYGPVTAIWNSHELRKWHMTQESLFIREDLRKIAFELGSSIVQAGLKLYETLKNKPDSE